MNRVKLFAWAVGFFVVVATSLSTAAFAALPTVLTPTGGEEATGFEGEEVAGSENTRVETTKGEVIECEQIVKKETNGTVPSMNRSLGSFHTMVSNCSTTVGGTKIECNSLGDSAGMVLLSGEYHLVWDKKGTGLELHLAILFLIKKLHLQCTSLVLLLLEGEQLCLLLKTPPISSSLVEFHCTIPEGTKGKQEDKAYFNDKEEEVPVKVTISLNGGTGIESAVLGLGLLLYLNRAGKSVTVEVMC
jgi:hypothetical protein